jgi:hypothetical protein
MKIPALLTAVLLIADSFGSAFLGGIHATF